MKLPKFNAIDVLKTSKNSKLRTNDKIQYRKVNLLRSIKNASSFLLSGQDKNGYWRDYNTNTGKSEAWTTAFVGLSLYKAIGNCEEITKAAKILLETIRPNGWGYNSLTECDADSTAWVIIFLTTIGIKKSYLSSNLLKSYISKNGRVHTYPPSLDYGSWGRQNDEVAPLVGMALLSLGELSLVERVRNAILRVKYWKSFWWQCYSYACAKSLDFLNLSGGIPKNIQRREQFLLLELLPPTSAFDLALRMQASNCLGKTVNKKELILLQQSDGGWLSSAELYVPSQANSFSGEPKADYQRLMSTAMCLFVLSY